MESPYTWTTPPERLLTFRVIGEPAADHTARSFLGTVLSMMYARGHEELSSTNPDTASQTPELYIHAGLDFSDLPADAQMVLCTHPAARLEALPPLPVRILAQQVYQHWCVTTADELSTAVAELLLPIPTVVIPEAKREEFARIAVQSRQLELEFLTLTLGQ